MKHKIQLDVVKINGDGNMFDTVHCNLYTGQRCVTVLIPRYDYENLIADGFFIRDGKERDSAGVLNTTAVFRETEC
jgi:hypothetical protein